MILRKLVVFLFQQFLFTNLSFAQLFPTTTTSLFLPSQCYTYTTISDQSRTINTNGNTDCDTIFMSGAKWVRFYDQSGTELITSPVDINKCNTQSTGWYVGPLPSLAQTVDNGTVCFSWTNNICQWTSTISVTNCGSFYVYLLTAPPVCPARYCTNGPMIYTTTPIMTTSSSLVNSPECYEYTTIDDPSRNVHATGYSKQCDQNNESFYNSRWVRFVGAGGTQIPTSMTQPNQCSTDASGWYSGVMPNVPDLTINGTICFSWETNSCWRSESVQVTNCGSFYVYRLNKPSVCSLRYCTTFPTIDTTTIAPVSTTPITTPTTTPITTPTTTPITTPTTTPITTTTATTTMVTTISYSQCSNYITIDDPTRSVNSQANAACDQTYFTSGPTWVRFVGSGGTQIPTNPIQPNRCSSQAVGWYSDEMPMTPYTSKNGTVCYSWQSNTCQWKNSIVVTNCGSYYVYQLSAPPACTLRYCTSVPTVPITTSTQAPTTQTTTMMIYPSQCYSYTAINDSSRGIDKLTGDNCDRNVFLSGPTWARFVGTGGTLIPTNPIGSNRCATKATGWYSGAMPSVAGATVNGTVCYGWQLNNCQWSNDIRVTNCGSYYVYQLSAPPTCDMRYCTMTPVNRMTSKISTMSYIQSLFKKTKN